MRDANFPALFRISDRGARFPYRPGIRLWGGEKFDAAGRFMHANVKRVEFSPMENYLVTYTWPDRPGEGDEYEAIIIWDVRTGEKKRAFKNDAGKDQVLALQRKTRCVHMSRRPAEAASQFSCCFPGRIASVHNVTVGLMTLAPIFHGIGLILCRQTTTTNLGSVAQMRRTNP